MAYKNKKKQHAHVRELHKTGLGKVYKPKVTMPAVESGFTTTMPKDHRKMSWLDRIVALWM